MQICELHQKYPGQYFPNCKCNTDHEGAVICAFHKKYPNQWLAACDCGVEEKKLRMKGHKFVEEKAEPAQRKKAHHPTILQAARLLRLKAHRVLGKKAEPVQRKKAAKKKGRKARKSKAK